MVFETKCCPVGSDLAADPAVADAAALLQQGELVAFPTETVYGLGADATNPDAVAKIFAAKQRPSDNPLIVHIARPDMVEDFCPAIPPHFQELADAFWPGSLTLVVPAKEELHQTVCRGLETIALRVPNHPVALAILERVGRGIAAPSANLSGRPSPTQAKHVMADLNGRLPLIVDGGSCPGGIESTVLDLAGDAPMLLRPGLVTADEIADVLGFPVQLPKDEQRVKRSPGTRYKHYAPNAPVYLVDPGVDSESFLRLVKHLEPAYFGARPQPEGVASKAWRKVTTDEMSAVLYRYLRELDDLKPSCILADAVAADGKGLSIMDRLKRAATHHFENAQQIEAFISGETHA